MNRLRINNAACEGSALRRVFSNTNDKTFPSSLNNETLAAGVGLMVSSTGSSQTYNYHKILAAETDVKQLSDDINDFNARYRVGSSNPTSALDSSTGREIVDLLKKLALESKQSKTTQSVHKAQSHSHTTVQDAIHLPI